MNRDIDEYRIVFKGKPLDHLAILLEAVAADLRAGKYPEAGAVIRPGGEIEIRLGNKVEKDE